MEAHGMFTARQDASVSRCTVHELNAAVHATGRNSFSNEHSGLTHLLFTVHVIALSFFEIAQMKYQKNNPEKKVWIRDVQLFYTEFCLSSGNTD